VCPALPTPVELRAAAPCAALNSLLVLPLVGRCVERSHVHAVGFLSYFMALDGSAAEELGNSYPLCLGENGKLKI